MPNDITTLRSQVRGQLSTLRSIDRLVQSPSFQDAYEAATEEQLVIIHKYILDTNYRDLWHYVRKITRSNYWEWTIVDLKNLARQRFIRNYSRMDKEQLVRALTNEQVN